MRIIYAHPQSRPSQKEGAKMLTRARRLRPPASRWQAIGLVAVFALLATACSSTASSTTATASSKRLSGSTIYIGSIIATTGVGINYPFVLAGAYAGVLGVNSRGGIDGHPVKLIECNDNNVASTAESCAREMVADHVIATAGDVTGFGTIVTPILNQAHIPEVGLQPYDTTQFTSPNSFPLDTVALGAYSTIPFYAKARGLKTLYMLASPGVNGLGIADTAAKAAGEKVVGTQTIPYTATNLTPYVEDVIASKAQVAVMIFLESQVVAFMVDAKQLGAHFVPAYAAGSLTETDYMEAGGANGLDQGMLEAGAPPPPSATAEFPELKVYASDMNAEEASDSWADPRYRADNSVRSWAAVQAIAKVANTIPFSKLNAASVLAALETAKNLNLGVIPPWTPSLPGLSPGFTRGSDPWSYFITVKNGVEVLGSPTPFNFYKAIGFNQ